MAIQTIQTFCAMCISRCGVIATVEDGKLTRVTADPAHPNGCICAKGAAAPEIVYSPDRLQYPMVRTRPKSDPDPGWARVSWDEALDLIATRLLKIKDENGPEAVVFSRATPSGSASSDFEPWVQRLANAFGSPNYMTDRHICEWHKSVATEYTLGVGIGHVANALTPDYDHARCILLWGFNPSASWPAAAKRISQARARGAKTIVIDPRKTAAAEKADVWLQVRPGADGVLAMAMLHVLLEAGLYDGAFARRWTNGPFLVRQDTGKLLASRDITRDGDPNSWFAWDNGLVTCTPEGGYHPSGAEPALTGLYDVILADGSTVACRPALALLAEIAGAYAPEQSQAVTGVAAEDVRAAVRLFATCTPSCFLPWLGVEQHADATQMNRAISLFYALTGQFDTPGSDVLFAATPTRSITGQDLLPNGRSTLRLGYEERPLGPARRPGFVPSHDVYRAALTGDPYPVKALVTFGSDPLIGTPDPLQGSAAFKALDLYVHIDFFANPSAAFADVLLPASTCWERQALMPSFKAGHDDACWVQFREATVEPLYESRPDLEIIFALAQRLGLGPEFFDGSIEAALNYQLEPSGLNLDRLRQHPGGIGLGLETRYRKYLEPDPKTAHPRGFQTPTRKVEVYSTAFADAGYPPFPEFDEKPGVAPDYPLTLTFFRLIEFCDEQHRNIPRLRRQVPDPFLEIHPATAAAAGIAEGEWLRVETSNAGIRLKARFRNSLHPDVVATAYGWWQSCRALDLPGYDPLSAEGSNANLLMSNDNLDPISGGVPLRSQRCRVRKA